jgi:hypothetical protein
MQVDDYTSDITITEFPLIYYFIGTLYKIFGFHEFIYKLVNILIGFTGLYFLFLLGLRAFRNTFYALIMPLLIFSSPIYVYYTNNFIPDATSLSIALIGLYFFYKFYEKGINRDLIISLILLCFAGLNKTPALLLYFAIIGLFIFERVLKISFKKDQFVFKNWPKQIASFSGVMFIIFCWYAYAKIYSDIHGGVVSPVEIRPIWILSSETIKDTWEAISKRFWDGNYHSPIFIIISLVLLIHNIIFWKKYDRMISILVMLSVLGGICFSLLFFRSMRQHDYYQMNNLIVLILIMFNFILYLKENQKKIYGSWITKTIFGVLIVFFIISNNNLLRKTYYGGWFRNYAIEHYNNRYDEITPYLRSLGISRYDKVYCTYDPSINISLYLMDQKGHTDFFRKDITFQQKVEFFHGKGCNYFIIGDYDQIDDVQPEEIGLEKIGEYNSVGIYKVE